MKNLIYTIVFMLMGFATIKLSAQTLEYKHRSINKAAKKLNIDPNLLNAVCTVESGLDATAFVSDDGGENNHAIGMCQLLYNTARDLGLNDKRCMKDFNIDETALRTYSDGCKLFGPYTSAFYAGKYLSYQLERYEGNLINAIAAYNSGSLILCKKGFYYQKNNKKSCVNGLPINWYHVKKVLRKMGAM